MRNDTWSELIAFPVTLGWGLAHRQNKHKVPVKVLVILCSPTPKDIFSHSSRCIQWRFWEGETNCVCAAQTQSNTMLIWHWKMKNCQNIFSRKSALVTLGNPKSSLNSLHLPFISTIYRLCRHYLHYQITFKSNKYIHKHLCLLQSYKH